MPYHAPFGLTGRGTRQLDGRCIMAAPSPDKLSGDTHFVTAACDGSDVALWHVPPFDEEDPLHAPTLEKVGTFPGHYGEITGLAVDDTGRHVVTVSEGDSKLKVWDTDSMACVEEASLPAHANGTPVVEVLHGGAEVVVGCGTHVDVYTLGQLHSGPRTFVPGTGIDAGNITAVTKVPQHDKFVTTHQSGHVLCWTVAGGDCVSLDELEEAATTVVVSPDGSIATVGTASGAARLYNCLEVTFLYEFPAAFSPGPVTGVVYCPTRYWLAVSRPREVVVYELEEKNAEILCSSDEAHGSERFCGVAFGTSDTVIVAKKSGSLGRYDVNL